MPLYTTDQHIDDQGVLRYRRQATGLRNRLRLESGALADPSEHYAAVLDGFKLAYGFFCARRQELVELIRAHLDGPFCIRYLARKTRHYVSVLEMLNLPSMDDYRGWTDYVFGKFSASGSFCEDVPGSLLDAELIDLQNRDVPYFWVNSDESLVSHHTGRRADVGIKRSVAEQVVRMFDDLGPADLAAQVDILSSFLRSELPPLSDE